MDPDIIEVFDIDSGGGIFAGWRVLNNKEKRKEGYDMERFLEAPREEFKCIICYGVLRQPMECENCGVLLCSYCSKECKSHRVSLFRQASDGQHTCPVCRSNQLPKEPSKILLKMIGRLKLKCKYYKEGCSYSSELSEIAEHQKNCSFKTIKCGNPVCKNKGKQSEYYKVEFGDVRTPCPMSFAVKIPAKFVCSEVCEKVVRMEYLIKNQRNLDEARRMFHDALVNQ